MTLRGLGEIPSAGELLRARGGPLQQRGDLAYGRPGTSGAVAQRGGGDPPGGGGHEAHRRRRGGGEGSTRGWGGERVEGKKESGREGGPSPRTALNGLEDGDVDDEK